MKIFIESIRDITVMNVKGKVTIDSGEVLLLNEVQKVLDMGSHKILFDLSEVTRIDSAGIGALVSAYTTSKTRGAAMKLCCLPANISELMTDTQLINMFEIYRNRDQAIASF